VIVILKITKINETRLNSFGNGHFFNLNDSGIDLRMTKCIKDFNVVIMENFWFGQVLCYIFFY